jgi:peptide/nickel transport system permease protein
MAILFISTVLVLIGYLISDILYTIVDPRIRLS